MNSNMSVKVKLQDSLPNYNTLVKPWHFVQALVAATRYQLPVRKMRVIGVTGTNGKTTTCFMIWKMLNEAGHKTGLMTTVAWGVSDLNKQIEHMTTVDSFTLNKRIREIRYSGAEFLVLEVTSHALAQFRTLGIPIEIAVLTNVTHDHLDYHGTFENYRNAKRKLFKKAKFGIVNADDPSGTYFMKDCKHYTTYGIKKGKLQARKIKMKIDGIKYETGGIRMRRADQKMRNVPEFDVETQIPGEFNIYNSLAAVNVGLYLGLSPEKITAGIKALTEVEGRMTRIDKGQDFGVIVDYAHTPDAFIKVYASVNKGVKGRVISLFGGAGRRDETTRFERGEIGGKYSDIVIVTEDDSRDESPEAIATEFVKGAEKAGKVRGKDLFVELNRKKAIESAIKLARKDDLVLVLGKGHEKTILRADGAHPFEDIKVTEEALEKRLQK